nr:MAG TPA: hypothetical protein [Caudoviricetes sp.]
MKFFILTNDLQLIIVCTTCKCLNYSLFSLY